MDKTFLSPEALITSIASLLPEHHQASAAEIASIKQTPDSSAKTILPALSVHDSSKVAPKTGGALGVIEDLGLGAYKELTEHTGRVVENAAIGLGIGVAATLLAPEIAAVAGAAALVYGGYELATHVGGWVHDAKVVADPSVYSKKDVAAAQADLQGVGAGGTDLLAGAAGGVLGSRLAGIGRIAIAGCESPEPVVAQSGASGEAVPARAPVAEGTSAPARAPVAKGTSAPARAPLTAETPAPTKAPALSEKAPVTDQTASSTDFGSSDQPYDSEARRFKIVKRDFNVENAKADVPGGHGKLVVREVGPDGTLGDELKVWIQHHGPVEGGNGAFTPMYAGAEKADLIISCFPNLMEDAALLAKHVFPNGSGVITAGLSATDDSIMVVRPEIPDFAKALMYPIKEMLAQLEAEEAADAAAAAKEGINGLKS